MKSLLLITFVLITTSCDTRPGDSKAAPRAATLDAGWVAVAPVAVVDAASIAVAIDAAVIDAAAPTPVDPVTEQQAVAELDALGDEFCACPDLDCAIALDERIAMLQHRFGGIKDSKKVRKAAERFAARAKECVAGLKADSGGENPAVLAMQKVASAVCACADLACAKAEMKRAGPTLEKYEKLKASAADQEKILAQFQRMAQCRNNLTPPD